MPWWLTLLIFVGSTIIGELLRPKPKFDAPKPSGLGDFQLPTASEGRAIPVVFGTVHMKGANVVWYGDLLVVPITKKVKTGLFSSTKVTTGYRYFIGADLVLCHGPIESLEDVRFDDRPIPEGSVTITGANSGMVASTIPTDPESVAHIAQETYKTLTALAQAAQVALRTILAEARVVYGFEVVAGVTDKFVYATGEGTYEPLTTATIAAGKYDGAAYAAALESALDAAEAAAAGGARLSWAVEFTGSRIRITASRARGTYDRWRIATSEPDVEFDNTTLPLIGAQLSVADIAFVGLPATFEGKPVGEKRFMFAYPGLNGKIRPSHASFKSAEVLGLDRTAGSGVVEMAPEVDTGGSLGVVGMSNPNRFSKALRGAEGSYVTTGGSGTGIPIACSVHLQAQDDPGDGGTWKLRARIRRSGTEGAGNVYVQLKLYAGSPESGDPPGTLVAGPTFTTLALGGGWSSHDYTLTPTEITNFRNLGGFNPATGGRLEVVISSDGPGNANNKDGDCSFATLEIPDADYEVVRNHRAAFERELHGFLVRDTGDVIEVDINAPTMFGGEEREGGVAGRIDLYKGTLTQTASAYLDSAIGAALPAYRGIAHAVLRRLYVGNSAFLKPISFVVTRFPNNLGLGSDRHKINGDANPAEMLYEILTNTRWGLGLPASNVDLASFRAAGTELFSESFGLSMILDSAASARDMMAEILRHVDGVLYTDPQTGKVRITLARGNYSPGDPEVLDDNVVISVKIARPSWEDTKNVAKVRYVDREDEFQDRVVQAQDLANIQIRGGEVSEEDFDFRGISNAAQAQKIAERALRTISYPLSAVEIECNRRAWRLRPGAVFQLVWAPLGINGTVYRITRISGGEVRSGVIKIDAVEDIFGAVRSSAFLPPAASGWVDPITLPVALAAQVLFEVPYALVVGPERQVIALGAQGSQLTLGYQVWADAAGGRALVFVAESREMTPTGTLARPYGETATTLIVASGPGMAALRSTTDAEFAAGKNLALIDDELVAWQFVTDNDNGTYTLSGVVRGVADTTPRRHAVGARVWFVTEGAGPTSHSPYEDDVTITAKLLAFTSRAVQALDEASEASLATNSRAQRPYVPTGIKVNGESHPAFIGEATITVSWEHRDRLGEWSYADAGKTAAQETGVTYTLRFYGDGDVLLKTYTGITGTEQTWDSEEADTPGVGLNRRVRIELEAVNASALTSFQKFNHSVARGSVGSRDIPVISRRPKVPRRRRHGSGVA